MQVGPRGDLDGLMIDPSRIAGVVHTSRPELERTPVQARANRAEDGTLEVHEPYVEGLPGLDSPDYAWLLSWLDGLDGSDRRC